MPAFDLDQPAHAIVAALATLLEHARANTIRHQGARITLLGMIFVLLARLCRNAYHFCTFATTATSGAAPLPPCRWS